MIEVSGLCKNYGSKRAVDDISFSVKEGEIVGFLGPNGAGKSTTMNIITGYLSATSGTASVAGINVLEDPIRSKRHVGYLPEQPPLYMDMTVKEYLSFVYELKGAKAKDRQGHINNICEMVSVTDVYGRLIKNLSKGYKQRVGLAQALIGDPDILVLDEPTIGLDPIQIIEMRGVIKNLGKSRTVILSSHILPEVQAVCERVIVIHNGKIVANDTTQALSETISGERRIVIRAAGPKDQVHHILRAVEGVSRVEPQHEGEPGAWDFLVEGKPNIEIRRPIFNALSAVKLPILMLRPFEMTLEDIFISLTTEQTGAKASKGAKAAGKGGRN